MARAQSMSDFPWQAKKGKQEKAKRTRHAERLEKGVKWCEYEDFEMNNAETSRDAKLSTLETENTGFPLLPTTFLWTSLTASLECLSCQLELAKKYLTVCLSEFLQVFILHSA